VDLLLFNSYLREDKTPIVVSPVFPVLPSGCSVSKKRQGLSTKMQMEGQEVAEEINYIGMYSVLIGRVGLKTSSVQNKSWTRIIKAVPPAQMR
jgi:hypothetical protein